MIPFLVALLLKVPLTLSLFSKTTIGARIAHWPDRFLFLGGLVVADLVLVIAALALAAYAVWEAVATAALDPKRGRNDVVRADALARIRDGYAGMITGHSHLAELTPSATASTPTPAAAPRCWRSAGPGSDRCPSSGRSARHPGSSSKPAPTCTSAWSAVASRCRRDPPWSA